MTEHKLTRTRSALETVVSYVSSSGDPQIASFLVQQLTIIFYSEMEAKMGSCVAEVFARFTDSKISNFLSKNQASIIKRIDKSDIVKFAHSFGDEVKARFNAEIDEQEAARYSNIITARHKVGHGPGVEISLSDIEPGIVAAEKILNTMDVILASNN